MSEATSSAALGTAVWTDVTAPDVPAAARFYGDLFGWEAEDMGEQAGHYHMFKHGGKTVAAATPAMNPSQPFVWSTYLKVDDAAAIARSVTDNGGQVLVEPFPVMDQGTMGVFMDPTGAAFSVWQPALMQGAEKFNEPVSFIWNELHTRDLGAAKRFYPAVFGWEIKANAMPGGGEYVEWLIGGDSRAGATGMAPGTPEGVPPHWLVYFAVNDSDATAARVKELGGQVIAPPFDSPYGKMAVLSDPNGATFAIIGTPAQ